ncbi:MAG: iron-sulfur cluster assembly accessory protein [Gammaproteobacteria bacterium]|jgi:iron-sulfur cluster assembly accessory protein
MNVRTFDPAQSGITMTAAALAHTRRQLAKVGGAALRLAIKKSGCSGYMYVVEYVETPSSSDTEFKIADDVSVYVDPESLPLVQGTEIDYVTEGLNSFIKFNNPNAQAECGCGESFSV